MHAYNPRKKTYQQLDSSLIGADRREFLDTLIQELSLQAGESPKQHWLVVGPRGIGKSHLLTLLYHKVKLTPDLSRLWIPVLFPEEIRLESNLAKFLERAVNEVIHELKEIDPKTADAIRDKIAKTKILPIQERGDYVFSVLSWITDTTGKYILFITENLQHLLGKKLSLIEQKKLRAFLQTNDAITLLGSATTVFNALHDHSHPFYNFFHIHRLADLSFDDMKVMIGSILTATGKADLAQRVIENEARIKALHLFTGGNPRMAVFLADILKTDVPEEMLDMMDGILDELTPYFETIFKDIPDCLEAVINTLAAFEPAQSPTEITAHLEGKSTTIRNYLKQLKDSGYVRVAFSRGRSNYYCLNEYLYRIWFQMRDSGHREETRWLLELLLMLYSPDTLLDEKEKAEGVCRMDDETPHAYSRLIVQAADFMVMNPEYCRVIEWCVASANGDEEKDAKPAEYQKNQTKISKLITDEKYDKAVLALNDYLKVNPEAAWAYWLCGECLRRLDRYDEAIEKFAKAVELDPEDYFANVAWGSCLQAQNSFELAIKQYQKSTELNPKSGLAYGLWGACLRDLGRYDEAIEKFAKAAKLDPENYVVHMAWGDCLSEVGQYVEAEKKYLTAVTIEPKYLDAYLAWGDCLQRQERYDEAVEKLKKAIEIDPECCLAHSLWGKCLTGQKKYDEAVNKFQKAFECDPDHEQPFHFVIECLKLLKRFAEAIDFFKKYHLDQGICSTIFDYGKLLLEAGRYQEASKVLAKLLKRKEKCTKAYLPYGRALAAMSDQEGALDAYLKYLKFNLGNFDPELDFHTIYQEDVQPILEKIVPGHYIEKLYTPEKLRALSKTRNCMILVLLGKHEIVREHIPAVLAETNRKSKTERDALELLFFAIKFMIWMNLCKGKIHEAISLIELYSEYIKFLPSMNKKEVEVRSLALGLLKLQIAKNINPDSTRKIFLQLAADPDIPFAEVLLKVLTCISEPDSLQSQQFLSDKIIAEVVKGLIHPKKKNKSKCDSCGISC